MKRYEYNNSFHPGIANDVTGIVKSTIEVQLERSDPNVFVVVAQTVDTAVYGFPTTAVLHGSGAGMTWVAARGAAIGECVERYACCFPDSGEWIYGSYNELNGPGYKLVPPEKWALFDPSQFNSIPDEPFFRTTPIAWVRTDNLSTRAENWVPACLVYMSSLKEFGLHNAKKIGPAISTGTACSTVPAEAILKGIYEVVERDAFIIMWRNGLACPRVRIDPSSKLFSTFKKEFERPGLEYNLFYTTMDFGIPSFFGYLRDIRRDPPAIIVGGAAHIDPNIAVQKTLLELIQGLKWIDYLGNKAVHPAPGYEDIRSFDDRVHLYAFSDMQQAFRFLKETPTEIELSKIPNLDAGSYQANLSQCLEIFRKRDMDVLAIDLTTIDVQSSGLNVIKVLIPGCEQMEGDHQFRLLGGNRWKDVPVRVGMRDSPCTLESINPYPHPYP